MRPRTPAEMRAMFDGIVEAWVASFDDDELGDLWVIAARYQATRAEAMIAAEVARRAQAN